MIFLFPEIPPERKMKDDLSEKIVFSKRLLWNMIFLVLSEKIYIFFGRKMEDDLSQEIHRNMIFFVYTQGRCELGDAPLRQKKIKDDLIPQKYT